MLDEFYGNEICCGSYACLNAIKDESISLKLFELSTSVPFGVKHMEDGTFDRLLTTFCDPNTGIDRALPLWGYEQRKKEFSDVEEMLAYLKNELLLRPVVLGPLDMGYLNYLPVAHLYRRMDHYILLEDALDGKVSCIDSEGMYGYRMDYEELRSYINVEKLLEASGKICVRSFEKRADFNITNIYGRSLQYAWKNMQEAEDMGQGSKAYLNCFRYLADQNINLWKLPLLYDINYLIQRKTLFLKLLEGWKGMTTEIGYIAAESMDLIRKQQNTLVDIFGRLKWQNKIDEDEFKRVSEEEKNIAVGMETYKAYFC